MGDNTSDKNNNQDSELRMSLVSTAIEFLKSPKVANSPLSVRLNFLKKKGLTDREIAYAVDEASKILPSVGEVKIPIHDVVVPQPRYSYWTYLHEAASFLAIASVVSYAVYTLYKKYGEPFFFGKKVNGKSLEVRLSEMETMLQESIRDIKMNMGKIREEIERSSERNSDNLLRQEFEDLKYEVKSLKKLFLNRKEFATLPTARRPVSIPEWQKASSQPEASPSEKELEEQSPSQASDKEDETSDRGSGSTNNGGSDSSLEVIK